MPDRFGAVTLAGNSLTVRGPVLQPGDPAPNFRLTAGDWRPVTLGDSAGMVRLISVVGSLETDICDAQTRRFNEEASALGDEVMILTVSADLPFTLNRWCGAAGVDRVLALSDHMAMSFGDAYGTHIVESRTEQRSIFVVDRENTVSYVEYVPDIDLHPDYEAALTAVRQALAADD